MCQGDALSVLVIQALGQEASKIVDERLESRRRLIQHHGIVGQPVDGQASQACAERAARVALHSGGCAATLVAPDRLAGRVLLERAIALPSVASGDR